jgi:hypothetical protein
MKSERVLLTIDRKSLRAAKERAKSLELSFSAYIRLLITIDMISPTKGVTKK